MYADPPSSAAVAIRRVTHAYSHLLMHALAYHSSYSSNSVAEYLLERQASALVYVAKYTSFNLGGLAALAEQHLRRWIESATGSAWSCVHDPVCLSERGGCHKCLAVAFGCERFNKGLDRGYLVGGGPQDISRATSSRPVRMLCHANRADAATGRSPGRLCSPGNLVLVAGPQRACDAIPTVPRPAIPPVVPSKRASHRSGPVPEIGLRRDYASRRRPGRSTLLSSARTWRMSSKYPTSIRRVRPRSFGPHLPLPQPPGARQGPQDRPAPDSRPAVLPDGSAVAPCGYAGDLLVLVQNHPQPVPADRPLNSHTCWGTEG